MGIFEYPNRITRIEHRTDKILAGGFDQLSKLPALHVTGMILDRHLQSHVLNFRPAASEDFNCVFDVAFDRNRSLAIVECPEECADDLRTCDLRGARNTFDLLLGGTLFRIESFGGWANRAHSDFEFDPEAVSMLPDLPDVVVFKISEESNLGEVDDVGTKFRCVIQ